MRPLAFLPILFSIAAIVLAFLCIFAGSKKNFMESYDLLTLNISRIGQDTDIFQNSGGDNSGLSGLIKNATSSITSGVTSELNDLVDNFANSLAQELGMEDFYSVHLLDYCEGDYTPGPVPNNTLKKSDIHRNVSMCSNRTSMFTFDPREALERSINRSTLGQELNSSDLLDQINWPSKIEDAIKALHVAFKAMFILYCIGIGLAFICLISSIAGIFGSGHRALPAINVLLFLLTFLTIGIASAIATAVAVKGTKEINKYGKEISIQANTGHKFMAITWAATAAMFLGSLVWCVGCILPGRKNSYAYNKHG